MDTPRSTAQVSGAELPARPDCATLFLAVRTYRLVDIDCAGIEFIWLSVNHLPEEINRSVRVSVGQLLRLVAELQRNVVLVVRRRDVETLLFFDVVDDLPNLMPRVVAELLANARRGIGCS